MTIKRTYESEPKKSYAESGTGQVVSRSLFAVVERGDMPFDGGFGEAEIIEVRAPFPNSTTGDDETMRVRIDTAPQDTIARDPDHAAAMAIAMQRLSNSGMHHLGFRVEYFI